MKVNTVGHENVETPRSRGSSSAHSSLHCPRDQSHWGHCWVTGKPAGVEHILHFTSPHLPVELKMELVQPLPSTPVPSTPLPSTLFCGGALCHTQGSLTRCFEKILCDESGSNTQLPLCRDAVVSEQQRLLAMPQLGVPAVDVPGTTCCEWAILLNKRWSEASPGSAEL